MRNGHDRKYLVQLALLLLCSLPAWAQINPGNVTNSYSALKNGGGTSASSFSFAHDSIGSFIVVGCSNNQYPQQQVTGVSVNGTALLEQARASLPTLPLTYLFSGFTQTGPVTITVKQTGPFANQHGHGTACFAEDFSGVNPNTPTWGVTTLNCDIGKDCPSGAANNSHQQTVACSYLPDTDGEVVVMFMYTTAYGPTDDKTELIVASPASPSIEQETGPFAAPQAAMAVSSPLTAGVEFTETWTLGIPVESHTSVQTSVISLVLYP